MKQYKNNQLKPYLKSETVPESRMTGDSPIYTFNADKLQDMIEGTKMAYVVLFCDDGSYICRTAKREFRTLSNVVSMAPGIKLATYDTKKNEHEQFMDVKTPAFYYFKGDITNGTKYKGAIETSKIQAWMQTQNDLFDQWVQNQEKLDTAKGKNQDRLKEKREAKNERKKEKVRNEKARKSFGATSKDEF